MTKVGKGVLGVGIVIVFALLLLLLGNTRPTDRELLERFHKHRADLDELVRMFEADKGLGRVGASFTRPKDPSSVGVSPERIQEYRRLCSAVGARACIEGYDAAYYRLYGPVPPGIQENKDPIWITTYTSGLSFQGEAKGYLYSVAPKFEIVQDLEDTFTRRSETWIKPLEGNWYIFFDVIN